MRLSIISASQKKQGPASSFDIKLPHLEADPSPARYRAKSSNFLLRSLTRSARTRKKFKRTISTVTQSSSLFPTRPIYSTLPPGSLSAYPSPLPGRVCRSTLQARSKESTSLVGVVIVLDSSITLSAEDLAAPDEHDGLLSVRESAPVPISRIFCGVPY